MNLALAALANGFAIQRKRGFWPCHHKSGVQLPLRAGLTNDFNCSKLTAPGTNSFPIMKAGVPVIPRALASCCVRARATYWFTSTKASSRNRSRIRSWPPAGNDFERRVFKTRSVQIYIVIGSRHRFAAGNWSDYEGRSAFAFEEEEALGRLVLPPELGSAVYIFRRKTKCKAATPLRPESTAGKKAVNGF